LGQSAARRQNSDGQDFPKYRKNEAERFEKWHEVVRRSHVLGEEFIHACRSGKISDLVQPL